MNGTPRSRRPSPRWGLRHARRLWRLVIACWVASVVSFLPAVWVVDGVVAPALENLPDVGSGVPAGEVQLIVRSAIREVAAPLRLAILSGALTLWMWTVLWHAGVVNWTLWASGRRVRLGELLGLGVVSWWRYALLSLVSAVAAIGAGTALLLPLGLAGERSYAAMVDEHLMRLLAAGVAGVVVVWVVWATTARAAWLIGLPERRSVAVAWLLGLAGTLRKPFVSLGTVALWVLPAALVSTLPLVIGLAFPALREGWAIPIVGQLAAAVRAFCWVGLFASFAPVTGLVGNESGLEVNPELQSP
jgi:hypothetical protein